MTKARTTTGILLAQAHSTGQFSLYLPNQPVAKSFPDATHLDDISAAAGLRDGYWLRSTPELQRTTWTWVQL